MATTFRRRLARLRRRRLLKERIVRRLQRPPSGGCSRNGPVDRVQWMIRQSGKTTKPAGICLRVSRLVGLTGLEPVTSALSGQRSNRLSYRPAYRSETLAHLVGDRQTGCPRLRTGSSGSSADQRSTSRVASRSQALAPRSMSRTGSTGSSTTGGSGAG